MQLVNALKKIINLEDLSDLEMTDVMVEIMTGKATPCQIAGFLIGLEAKGPSISEVTAATKVMRRMSTLVQLPPSHLIDIVGTGGDGVRTFNISTTSMFVIAAAGGVVAKHGNRAVSSSSGSADVLECAGVNLDLNLAQVKACIEKLGVGFFFAPQFHPALKHAALPRKELGVRTFLNLLGPLTNPANAPFLVIGVYSEKWLMLLASVLKQLGCQHAVVIHSEDGLDEISIAAPTTIAEVSIEGVKQYQVTPEQFGFKTQSIGRLQVDNPAQSLAIMLSVLNNDEGPARDIVLLNAGMALYVCGLAKSISEGIEKGKEVLANGKASEKLSQLITFTNSIET